MAQVFKKINKKIFLTFFDDFFRDLNRKSNFSQNISIFRGSRYHFWNRLIKSNKKKKNENPHATTVYRLGNLIKINKVNFIFKNKVIKFRNWQFLNAKGVQMIFVTL